MQWNGWHIFVFGWSACLFIVVAIVSAQHALGDEARYSITLKIGTVLAIAITFAYLYTLPIVAIRIYSNLTEWYWGYFYLISKEIAIKKLHKCFQKIRKRDIIRDWYWTQLEFDYLYIHPKVLIIKMIRLCFFLFLFLVVIGKYDLDTYTEMFLKLEIFWDFKKYYVIHQLFRIYICLIFLKYLIIYMHPYYNHGYKHVGLLYKNKFIHMPSRDWLYDDEVNRFPNTKLKTVINKLNHKYELPPFWNSWKQIVVDHVPFVFYKGKIFNLEKLKYKILSSNFILTRKSSRFDEFSYEIWPLDIYDTKKK